MLIVGEAEEYLDRLIIKTQIGLGNDHSKRKEQ